MSREEQWTLGALLSLLLVTGAWWALALWPSSAEFSPWLARTQAVCFGVTESGLPSVTGWVGLTAPPVGMLLVLLVSAGDSIRRLRVRVRTVHWLQALGVAVALLLAAGSATAGIRIHSLYTSSDLRLTSGSGTWSKTSRIAPPLDLADQSGAIVRLPEFVDTTVMVTFAYAHCETVCPLLVRNALSAQAVLARVAEPVKLVVVTLDARRDTPSRLPAIALQWGLRENAHVLSGPAADVDVVLTAWGVGRSYDDRTGDVAHASVLYVVRNGRIIYETVSPSTELLIDLIGAV